ncbi:NAD-dependent epimerase/dehydratase family protein [Mycolicibacterium neoaurum]|uniref:NAD dependent epimerase/dehydratase n=1 Tax=Mycolicibacterium neoaurum TaxID=1795 RepID=A0AAV2WSE2_MYCNE|nr:NAD-dependent epimerase/dehydratase family protein [Mycolicibacterium neoaurum]TLH59405.1 epimerase [Mycolicibacterium neoaurum]CDQ46945.1 NAD dependent epimerase/dehydratase [Mycolicibacterium neoaurum]
MKRILITGGAGFIGSRLANKLHTLGHAVTVLDCLSPQVHGSNPSSSELLEAAKRGGTVIVGDVTDRDVLAEALAGQDVVIHLAAETGTGQSMYQIERYCRVNVGGTALLLDILANDPERSVKKLLVASSRSIYGEGRYLSKELGYVYPKCRTEQDLLSGRFEPTHENDISGLTLTPTTEDSKIHPSSVYGITKHTQESLVMTVGPTIGIAPVALRYQNVYGPGQSLANPYTGILSIFSTLIRQSKRINVFEDGMESRDFIFIDDVVNATCLAALRAEADGRVLNIGSGVGTTVLEVVEELMCAYNRRVPVDVTGNFRLGDIRHNVADITLARNVLGFRPEVNFREGVRRFAEWVQSQEIADGGYEASLDEMRVRKLLK